MAKLKIKVEYSNTVYHGGTIESTLDTEFTDMDEALKYLNYLQNTIKYGVEKAEELEKK